MNDIFDKIYVISTFESVERHVFIFNQMKSVNLQYELRISPHHSFFPFMKTEINHHSGDQSLCANYASIIAESMINNYNIIMFVEDDTQFIPNFRDKFIKFYKHIPDDWDVLHMGDYTNEEHIRKRNINEYVDLITWKYTTNCMVLKISDKMIDLYNKIVESKYPIDHVFNHFYGNLLTCYSPTEQFTMQQSYRNDQGERMFKSLINF